LSIASLAVFSLKNFWPGTFKLRISLPFIDPTNHGSWGRNRPARSDFQRFKVFERESSDSALPGPISIFQQRGWLWDARSRLHLWFFD
jgi:hypothetical protein